MHKFIVNNRIRSDPPKQQLLSPNNSSGPTTTTVSNNATNKLNAVMNLKMALPCHPQPVAMAKTGSASDVGGTVNCDANNNKINPPRHNGSGSSNSSRANSSASDCTHSSQGSREGHRDVRQFPKSSSSSSGGDTNFGSTPDKSGDAKVSTNPIRMSGYLKKKRNRVGGWRKLWFVLQNQLLLSYSSKEDYEKKLAPFKDLINLVPGTVIKPAAGGARFTIETTANVVYTFRCDNNKVCSDWITAICECLGIRSRRRSIPSLTSQKWSLNRQPNKRIPKLPMAKNTARIILQKGIIYEPIDHIAKVQQDFRLHQADVILGRQSNDVSRINRMFDVQGKAERPGILVQVSKSPRKSKGTQDGGGVLNNSERIVTHRNSGCGALKGRPIIISRKMETLPECDDIEEQMQCITLEDTSLLSIPQEDSIEEHQLIASASPVTDFKQIALMNSGSGSSGDSGTALLNGEPIYAVIDLKEKYQRRAKLNKHAAEQQHLPLKGCGADVLMNGRSSEVEVEGVEQRQGIEVEGEPSVNSPFRVVDANIPGHHLQLLRRQLHKGDQNNNVNDKGEEADVVDGRVGVGGAILSNNNESKIRSTTGFGERPKSFQLYSSADYEEIHHFSHLKFSEPNSSAEDNDDDEDPEENIYEPINIPEEELTRGHRNLWRYFPKINFDAILEMGKRRHHPLLSPTANSSAFNAANNNINNNSGLLSSSTSSTTSSSSSPQISSADSGHPVASGSSSVSSASTTSSSFSSGSFSGMRKKLGTHRKSIKNRMKRMYTRSIHQPSLPSGTTDRKHQQLSSPGLSPAMIAIADDNNRINLSDQRRLSPASTVDLVNKSTSPSPPPLPSVNLPKRERNSIFTSLSRLRKTRTGIVACEEVPKQKRLFVIPDSAENTSRNVCHSSTFYDND